MSFSSFAQYRIDAELGTGRFTETYRAYDPVRRRPAALKLLRAGLLDSEPAFRDFLTQVGAASELIHPHLAWVWETGEANGRFFLVERYVNGGSLAARLADSGLLTWQQARPMVESLAEALEFAHARGWIHGGISPQDILLSPDLGAVLTDFGLARALQTSDLTAGSARLRYAAAYLPPEALQGASLSPATDAYALACTLLESLAGQNPFAADSLGEIIERHAAPLVQPLVPPERAPWAVSGVIEQALSPDPGTRFQSLADFLTALDRAASPPATGSSELAQQEAQILAWRAAEEQARLEAEETARLAALEQARLEIQQQAHREALQLGPVDLDPVQGSEPLEPASPALPARRRLQRARARRRSWLPWSVLLVSLLVLAGIWLNARLSSSQPPTSTPPATHTIPAALPTEALTSAPTASLTSSPTASPPPTATLTRTPTPTRTSTASPTPTLQPSHTPTFVSTPTRFRPNNANNRRQD